MKYKKVMILLIVLSVFLIGCSARKDAEEEQAKPVIEENEKDMENDEVPDESQMEEENEAKSQDHVEKKMASIYYIDDMGNLASRAVEVKDENDIWAEMQKDGILSEECQLLNFQVDEVNGTIDVDFNTSTGDRIRNMGTTGETEILACITSTFLDSYKCEKIKLTEEGKELSTSHGAAVSGYIERITL